MGIDSEMQYNLEKKKQTKTIEHFHIIEFCFANEIYSHQSVVCFWPNETLKNSLRFNTHMSTLKSINAVT